MPTLKISALEIAQNLKGKLLATKPIENYNAEYIAFVVRIALLSTLGNVSSVSAKWNAKRNCWEGNLHYLGKNKHWQIAE